MLNLRKRNYSNELIYKTERQSQMLKKTYSYQREKKVRGINQEIGIDI